MGAIAHRKWAALRALHEDWGAPLSLLESVMERGVLPNSVSISVAQISASTGAGASATIELTQ